MVGGGCEIGNSGTLWATGLSLGQFGTQPKAPCDTFQSSDSMPAGPTADIKYNGISETILGVFFLENCLFSCKIVYSVIV